MEKSVFQNSRASLFFGVITALGAVVGVLATLVFLVTGHPHRAVWILGITCGGMAVLRALWPGRPWFASRSRWTDVLVFLIAGGGLILLAPWTAAVVTG